MTNLSTRNFNLNRIAYALFIISTTILCFSGWKLRGQTSLTAESGIGYGLGVVGFCMMFLICLYSLRKRWRRLHSLGGLKQWFRWHMVFGVVGPVCILFHANFSLGSINSSVALIVMLIVFLSGFAGRYFYTRIHNGLYGHQKQLQKLIQGLQEQYKQSILQYGTPPDFFAQLIHETTEVQKFSHSLWGSSVSYLKYHLRLRSYKQSTLNIKDSENPDTPSWTTVAPTNLSAPTSLTLEEHRLHILYEVHDIYAYSFYERLFSLWHYLHLPLCFLLFITGAFHILAVHAY